MPDQIGNITVPEIAVSGTFPIVADYPFGRSSHSDVAIHQFGSGNAKIEQRFLLGSGAKRFTVRRAWLRDAAAARSATFGNRSTAPMARSPTTRPTTTATEPPPTPAGSPTSLYPGRCSRTTPAASALHSSR